MNNLFLKEKAASAGSVFGSVIKWLVEIFTLVVVILLCINGSPLFGVALWVWFLPYFIVWGLAVIGLIVVLTFALILYIADNQ